MTIEMRMNDFLFVLCPRWIRVILPTGLQWRVFGLNNTWIAPMSIKGDDGMWMSWTEESPTETGMYWALLGREEFITEIKEVTLMHDNLLSLIAEIRVERGWRRWREVRPIRHFALWLGPIPKPEPPR